MKNFISFSAGFAFTLCILNLADIRGHDKQIKNLEIKVEKLEKDLPPPIGDLPQSEIDRLNNAKD